MSVFGRTFLYCTPVFFLLYSSYCGLGKRKNLFLAEISTKIYVENTLLTFKYPELNCGTFFSWRVELFC